MRTWVYHKDHAAKIVDSSEYDGLYKDGWRDSPHAAYAVQFEVKEEAKTESVPDVVIVPVNTPKPEDFREKRKYNKRHK